MITRITIVGTGLIGGSFALALRESGFRGSITGCDKPEVLREALQRGAVDHCEPDLSQACKNADVIVLGTPICTSIRLLPQVAAGAPADSLITDTGSTKGEISRVAREVFGDHVGQRFLPGHPIAGREQGGIGSAVGCLFRNTNWILTPLEGDDCGRTEEFRALVASVGARVLQMSAQEHDLVLAFTSHLPQIVSSALVEAAAASLPAELDLKTVSGSGWRDMTRLSHSPADIWHDIFLTNAGNITQALDSLDAALHRIRQQIAASESAQKSSSTTPK